jgi:sulfur carrier protein
MKITVNGNSREMTEPQTLADLMEALDLTTGPCAVERNRSVVPRSEHDKTHLHDGDAIEIVTLVGGG